MKTLLFAGLHKPFSKKRLLLCSLSLLSFYNYAQNVPQDSTKINQLDEVMVKAVRANDKTPIPFSNLSKFRARHSHVA